MEWDKTVWISLGRKDSINGVPRQPLTSVYMYMVNNRQNKTRHGHDHTPSFLPHSFPRMASPIHSFSQSHDTKSMV